MLAGSSSIEPGETAFSDLRHIAAVQGAAADQDEFRYALRMLRREQRREPGAPRVADECDRRGGFGRKLLFKLRLELRDRFFRLKRLKYAAGGGDGESFGQSAGGADRTRTAVNCRRPEGRFSISTCHGSI